MVAAAVLLAGCQREHERLLKEFETSKRTPVRAGALDRLAELNQDEDFHLFLKATRDPSPLVRRVAVKGLGRSGDAKAIDTLGELLGDPDYDVESEAAKSLSRFNTDKARAYLLSSYGRRDGPAREAIAVALGPAGFSEAIRHEAKALWDRNIKALEAGGAAERVGAAEELGRSGRGEAVERLLPLLGDDWVLVAAGAARGLGAARDKRAVPSLVGVLKENLPALREATAEALGALGDPSAIPALEKVALEGGSGAVAAVHAIGQLAFVSEGRQSLCKVAAEGTLDVAALAARLSRRRQSCPAEPIVARLGRGGADTLAALAALEGLGAGDSASDRVAALLDSSDRTLKVAAARVLAALSGGSETTGTKVVKLLEAEAERLSLASQKWVKVKLPRTARDAKLEGVPGGPEHERAKKLNDLMAKADALNEAKAQALGVKVLDLDAARGLDIVDDLAHGEDELLRLLVLVAGRLKAPGAQAVLERLVQDARASTRAAACEAIAFLVTPAALSASAKCLDDLDRSVLRATAHGLSISGAPEAASLLLKGLERPSSERLELVRALGEMKSREAAPKTAALLTTGGGESIEAAIALGRLGDPTYASALAEVLKDHTSPARLDIIQALGALGEPSVAGQLVSELYNERPEVRAAAARALGKLDRAKAGPTLEALRSDYYVEVRRAADEALGAAPAPGAH